MNRTHTLHELKIWVQGFAAAIEKNTGNSPLTRDQWKEVIDMIMAAQDTSTEGNAVEFLVEN